MPSAPPSSFLPLVAYAEALCVNARVLFIGDARSEIASRLLERGARLVHVCDEAPARRAEGAQRTTDRAISFGALDDGSFALREAFFDLALIENLASHSEPKAVLASVSRLLAPRGAALIAAPNPDSRRRLLSPASSARVLDYYALYDAVAAAFPRVRMLGQVPFVGYAVVDFASEGEPEVVFDASLVPGAGEEPEYFVAVAGEERIAVDSYAVIQLPSSAVLGGGSSAPAAPIEAAPPAALKEPEKPAVAPITPAGPQAVGQKLGTDAQSDELARRRQEAWIQELEARAVAADERADTAETELDELRERYGNLEQRSRQEAEALLLERQAARTELERQQRQKHDLGELLQAAQGQAQAAKDQVDAAKGQVEAAKGQVEAAKRQAEAAKIQITALEGQVRRLEEQVRTLEQQIRTLEQQRATLAEQHAALEQQHAALAEQHAAPSEDPATSEELQKLETQLVERGEHVRLLERQLREAERTGRELVRRLQRGTVAALPVSAAPLSPAATVSAERLAELEAERQVLTWALAIARAEAPAGAGATLPPLLLAR
jgi:SAM-dependent methyltransferase